MKISFHEHYNNNNGNGNISVYFGIMIKLARDQSEAHLFQ